MELLKKMELSHFRQMEQLERDYYDDAYITSAEQAYAWYERYPYTTTAVEDQGNIVGFLNLFPVVDTVFEKIMAGDFNDKDLMLDAIVDINASETEPLHMFLSCIVVKEEYRALNTVRMLLKNAVNFYAPVAHRCDVILLDTVTPDGERFARKYGFTLMRQSRHGSWIYSQRYARFQSIVL